MIPKDPMILLSYVNTQLRDYYDSLEALCTCRGLNRESLLDKMDSIDYHYEKRPISLFEITIFNNLIPLVKAVKTAWQAVFFCYRKFLLRIT